MMKSNVFPVAVLLLLATLFGTVSYFVLQYAFISDDELDTYTGEVVFQRIVTETGPLTRDATTGARERTSQDYFTIRLKGLKQTLSYYSSDERYGELSAAVNPGDVVTVRYASYDRVSDLDIYEIEKAGTVILDGSGKRLTGKIFGFIVGLGAVFFLLKARSVGMEKDEDEPKRKSKGRKKGPK